MILLVDVLQEVRPVRPLNELPSLERFLFRKSAHINQPLESLRLPERSPQLLSEISTWKCFLNTSRIIVTVRSAFSALSMPSSPSSSIMSRLVSTTQLAYNDLVLTAHQLHLREMIEAIRIRVVKCRILRMEMVPEVQRQGVHRKTAENCDLDLIDQWIKRYF